MVLYVTRGYGCEKDPIKNLLYRKHPVVHTPYTPLYFQTVM